MFCFYKDSNLTYNYEKCIIHASAQLQLTLNSYSSQHESHVLLTTLMFNAFFSQAKK